MKYAVTTNTYHGGDWLTNSKSRARQIVRELSGRGLNPRIRKLG